MSYAQVQRQLFDFLEENEPDNDFQKDELAEAARKIQRRSRGLLGGGDMRVLRAAVAREDLDKDQLGRVKLLAREFLFLTL